MNAGTAERIVGDGRSRVSGEEGTFVAAAAAGAAAAAARPFLMSTLPWRETCTFVREFIDRFGEKNKARFFFFSFFFLSGAP
jgi:hypothetical protein